MWSKGLRPVHGGRRAPSQRRVVYLNCYYELMPLYEATDSCLVPCCFRFYFRSVTVDTHTGIH
jgi:hypothetical protein